MLLIEARQIFRTNSSAFSLVLGTDHLFRPPRTLSTDDLRRPTWKHSGPGWTDRQAPGNAFLTSEWTSVHSNTEYLGHHPREDRP
jgi:hypothetical protein